MKKKISIMLLVILLLIIIIFLFKCIIDIYNTKKIKDTLPYLLGENCKVIEKDVKKGMTVKDDYNNEWVWIVVPKIEVFHTAKFETDYDCILNDIKEYTKDYRKENYEDIDVNQKVLSSIYHYGGFWISRYEIGLENEREQNTKTLQTCLSQPNKYVYNYVTFNQAKELATQISENTYDTSLLYGFQWDLVCKFIENNGYNQSGEKITKEMININSRSWGNYYSSEFTINRGKYQTNYNAGYENLTTQTNKGKYKNYLLTTGASEHNKVCNIYDFAGNVSEWTLETFLNEDTWNTIRDGSFYFNYGGNDPVSGRYSINSESSNSNYGFRICITNFNIGD